MQPLEKATKKHRLLWVSFSTILHICLSSSWLQDGCFASGHGSHIPGRKKKENDWEEGQESKNITGAPQKLLLLSCRPELNDMTSSEGVKTLRTGIFLMRHISTTSTVGALLVRKKGKSIFGEQRAVSTNGRIDTGEEGMEGEKTIREKRGAEDKNEREKQASKQTRRTKTEPWVIERKDGEVKKVSGI